jgi:hypothetical protein
MGSQGSESSRPVSRRSFLVKGSVAAAGATGAAAVGLTGLAQSAAAEAELDEGELAAASEPMLLQVRDAAAGEVELLVDDRSIVFTDKALVAKVLRADR